MGVEYVEKAENNFVENRSSIDKQENSFKEVLKQCMDGTISSTQQWGKTQDCLKNIIGEIVTSIGSTIRIGSETNQLVRSKRASSASSITDDVNIANKDLISSIKYSLKLDHDINENIHSTIIPCTGILRDLNGAHSQKV